MKWKGEKRTNEQPSEKQKPTGKQKLDGTVHTFQTNENLAPGKIAVLSWGRAEAHGMSRSTSQNILDNYAL